MARAVVRAALVLVLVAAVPAAAQSPSPGPSASPSPYHLVPSPKDVPTGSKPVPDGPPIAEVTQDGIRLELWQSSPSVAPGEWVRFVVRTTNVGTDDAWQTPGSCDAAGARMTMDLAATIPAGEPQTGNAGELKARLLAHIGESWIPQWRYLPRLWQTATVLSQCLLGEAIHRLRPGQSLVEPFAWYAGIRQSDGGGPWLAPYPGTANVIAEWPLVGRGRKAQVLRGPLAETPVRFEVPLELTGDGPGTPSLGELIDVALADPAWRAWVDADPTRERWTFWMAMLWPGPEYPDWIVGRGDLHRFGRPNGIQDLELSMTGLRNDGTYPGFALLDPWTGELLQVIVPDEPPALSPPPRPGPRTGAGYRWARSG
ncbi:MAG: hypothetical protein U0869_08035 [Chloroflexota bacterium]